jgi:glycosyltransferase involved in cell wall biosynthesis
MVKISVVICTYNRSKFLKKAFDSIKNQKCNKNDFEIILVNNNSIDNTEVFCHNYIKENPDLRFKYFVETNQGLSHARNRGIKESNGEFITFVDDDAWADKDFIKKSIGYLETDSSLAVVGGKIFLDYEKEAPKWVSRFLLSLFGYYNLGNSPVNFNKRNYPRGSNMTYRKVIFDKYGGFNTDLGRNGGDLMGNEEKEIFIRIFNKGEIGIYHPDLIVYHAVPVERTQLSFIKKQAIGIGRSERIRSKSIRGLEYNLSILKELSKWGGAFVFSLSYLLSLQFTKSIMLIKFRFWFTQGMLGKYEK